MTQDRLAAHVHRCLEVIHTYRTHANAVVAKIDTLEAAGIQVIDGDQGASGDAWEITDWRTGGLIASGSGGHDGWGKILRELDPCGSWVHVDWLIDQIPAIKIHPDRIPQSLADAIETWVESSETPDEDIAEIAGWPVEKVREHRTPASPAE